MGPKDASTNTDTSLTAAYLYIVRVKETPMRIVGLQSSVLIDFLSLIEVTDQTEEVKVEVAVNFRTIIMTTQLALPVDSNLEARYHANASRIAGLPSTKDCNSVSW